MKITHLILAAGLALGIGGTASASQLAPTPAEVIQHADVGVAYAKRGRHGWKGHRGRHYGWHRGRHRGWSGHHRRVYYAYPRRHYRRHYRPAYYAYPRRHYRRYYRPAYYAYPRRHYGYGYYPRSRGIYIGF